jgi:hypothetical protein
MNNTRLLVTSVIVTALVAVAAPALAQSPKIQLDVEDLSAEAGHTVPIGILINNLEDSIRAFQMGVTLNRPDIMEFIPDLVIDTCYDCADDACTSYVAYPCTLAAVPIDAEGTLTEKWDYLAARTVGGFDLRITGISDYNFDGDPEGIPAGASGVLLRVLAEVKCIPDTLSDRTAVLTISPINTYFSNPGGEIIEPLEFTAGSVTVEPNGICPHQGDIEPDGFITSIDLAGLISALFEGGEDPQDVCCPTSRFDMDCDGFLTSLDLSVMIDYLFSSGPGPCDPTAP